MSRHAPAPVGDWNVGDKVQVLTNGNVWRDAILMRKSNYGGGWDYAYDPLPGRDPQSGVTLSQGGWTCARWIRDRSQTQQGLSGEAVRTVEPAQGIPTATSAGVGSLCSRTAHDDAGSRSAGGSELRPSESVAGESRGGAMVPRRALTPPFSANGSEK